jgi:hypothetical protein
MFSNNNFNPLRETFDFRLTTSLLPWVLRFDIFIPTTGQVVAHVLVEGAKPEGINRAKRVAQLVASAPTLYRELRRAVSLLRQGSLEVPESTASALRLRPTR